MYISALRLRRAVQTFTSVNGVECEAGSSPSPVKVALAIGTALCTVPTRRVNVCLRVCLCVVGVSVD